VCVQRLTKAILGTSRRGSNKLKGAWWWNEEVKEKVKEKKEAYTAFINSGADEEKEISRVRYKAAKKIVKKAVAVTRVGLMISYIRNWSPRKVKRKSLNWRGLEKEQQGIWVLHGASKMKTVRRCLRMQKSKTGGKGNFSNSSMVK